MYKFGQLIQAIDDYVVIATAKQVYGPYKKDNGRQFVIVRDENETRTVSYPKWLMEQKLGRRLDPDKETVHHLDGNHSNNDENNLEIIPRKEHSANDTRRVKQVQFKCDMCGKDFERSPRLVRDKSRKGAVGIFCGRSCSGRHNRLRQLNQLDILPEAQPYIESEYYKRRPVKASIDHLIEKYSQLDPWEPNNQLVNKPKVNYPIPITDLSFDQRQRIQNNLNDKNNEVKEDGLWGPITMRNLENYERMHGLWVSKPYTINFFTLNKLLH